MREIKFRAFKKKMPSRGMYAVEGIDFRKKSIQLRHGFHSSFWVPFRGVELMEYTGLKDKNGKEIYEADIIEADWGYGCPKVKVELDSIYYAKGECCISEEIQVIDNIYENPELLKDD